MKHFILLSSLIVLFCIRCTPPKTEAVASDSISVIKDSIPVVVTLPPSEETSSTTVEESGFNDKGVYIIRNQYSYISDPFDFTLSSESLKEILGPDVVTNEVVTEGGEDYGPYTHITAQYGDNELRFYDYSGKHYASISTPLLPFKKGIKVGMSKTSFLEKMELAGDSVSTADVFTILDDYGSMSFNFQADTLYWVYVNYEEGD